MFWNNWGSLPLITGGQSRAIKGENPRGEKGRGGMAASVLGPEGFALPGGDQARGDRHAGGD